VSQAARHTELLERIATALEKLVGPPAAAANTETVDVKGAAELLHTTPRVIYVRHQKGQMPRPIPGSRRLIWRRADLLRGK
jgi:hypothetical protein